MVCTLHDMYTNGKAQMAEELELDMGNSGACGGPSGYAEEKRGERNQTCRVYVCRVLCACMLYMLLHADPVVPLLLLRFLRLLFFFFSSSSLPGTPLPGGDAPRREEEGGGGEGYMEAPFFAVVRRHHHLRLRRRRRRRV